MKEKGKYFSHFIFCFALFFFCVLLFAFFLVEQGKRWTNKQKVRYVFFFAQHQIKQQKRFTKLTKRKVFQFYQHFFLPCFSSFSGVSFVWISHTFSYPTFWSLCERFRKKKYTENARILAILDKSISCYVVSSKAKVWSSNCANVRFNIFHFGFRLLSFFLLFLVCN